MQPAIPPPPQTGQSFGGNSNGAGNSGLIRVLSNSQLDAIRQKAEMQQNEPEISAMAAYVRRCWEAARNAKQPVYRKMIKALRQRKGEYDPQKLNQIRSMGGSEVFMNLTKTKCKAAVSWLKDVMLPADDKPWSIKPTPKPSMPPVVEAAIFERVQYEAEMLAQAGIPVGETDVSARLSQISEAVKNELLNSAKKSSARMEEKIDDQFREGGWYEALEEFIDHITTYQAAFMRGPVFRRRVKLKWEMFADGSYHPVRSSVVVPEYYSPSPFDIYPSPASKGVNDGYLIERHMLRRSDLVAMRGVPGYSEDAIDAILYEHGHGQLRDWLWEDQERQVLENRERAWLQSPEGLIEALEFSGKIQGKMLLEWGIKKSKVPDPMAEYEANIWMIGRWIFCAKLNADPLCRRDYFKCSFEEIPGAFWGEGIPEAIEDTQAICNAVARALVNNVAIASGPQAEVFEDRIMAGEDITGIVPLKIWQTKSDPTGGGHRAVNFHQPQLVAQHLIRIYSFFSDIADNESGIPKYVYGDANVGGSGRTASGLSMLMSSASKGLKAIVATIDSKVIAPSVTFQYDWNMQNLPDMSIKGDAQVHAKGSITLIAKEQTQVRRTEFAQMSSNPIDLSIMGKEGRANLLREIVKSLDMPANDIIPSPEKLAMQALQELNAIDAPMDPNNQDKEAPAENILPSGARPTDAQTFPNT